MGDLRAVDLGDDVESVEWLNGLHDPLRGNVVVHVEPGVTAQSRLDTAVMLSLSPGQSQRWLTREAGRRKVVRNLLKGFGVKNLIVYPADSLLSRDLGSLSMLPVDVIWLCFRRRVSLVEYQHESNRAEDTRENLRISSDRSNGVWGEPSVKGWRQTFAKDAWPENPMTARTDAMTIGDARDYSRFDWRWISAQARLDLPPEGFFGIGVQDTPQSLSRWLRTVCVDAWGGISPAAYCGVWSKCVLSGLPFEDPLIHEPAKEFSGPDGLENAYELSNFNEALVYCLVEVGFSLAEVASLRVDQVRWEGESAYLGGVSVTGEMGRVLKCAFNQRWDEERPRCLKFLIETTEDEKLAWLPDERIEQIKDLYYAGEATLRGKSQRSSETKTKYENGRAKLPTSRRRVRLSSLEPGLPLLIGQPNITFVETKAIVRTLVHLGLKLETLEGEDPGILVGLESLANKGLAEEDPKGERARLKVPIQHNFDCAGVDSLLTVDSKHGEFRNMLLRLANTAEALDHESFSELATVEELDQVKSEMHLLTVLARARVGRLGKKRRQGARRTIIRKSNPV